MKHIELFTDGACSGNPGAGGWGALLRYNGVEKELSGGCKQTTNNKMELTAVIEGLSKLKEPCFVLIYTDSKYVLEGAQKWLASWKANNWKKADKKAVLNQDLWQQLDALLQKHTIEWQWVKGHAGHAENERVDKLACAQRDFYNTDSKTENS